YKQMSDISNNEKVHDELAMIELQAITELRIKDGDFKPKKDFFRPDEEEWNASDYYDIERFDNYEEFEISSEELIKKFHNEINKVLSGNIHPEYIPFDRINYNIDYSNTNANIDLSHSLGYNTRDYLRTACYPLYYCSSCNFENVNLYNSGGDDIGRAERDVMNGNYNMSYCNLKNTNFSLPGGISDFSMIYNCDLENTDLSNYPKDNDIIDFFFYSVRSDVTGKFHSKSYYGSGDNILCNLMCCNLRNTGVSLDGYEYDPDDYDYDSIINVDSRRSEYFEEAFTKEYFSDFMNNGYYLGCSIGQDQELVESKNQIIRSFMKYPKIASLVGILSYEELLDSINKQIDSKKKKDINDMLNEKVEMIESSIDEQIKSKQ
ncbi:MAG: hypothetical protein ILA19_04650, partial [Bacilli bacterium]|nr:hypothetical protein [Bacilli bacterium]